MKGFCWVGSSQWTVWRQVAGFRSDEAVLNVGFRGGGCRLGIGLHRVSALCGCGVRGLGAG